MWLLLIYVSLFREDNTIKSFLTVWYPFVKFLQLCFPLWHFRNLLFLWIVNPEHIIILLGICSEQYNLSYKQAHTSSCNIKSIIIMFFWLPQQSQKKSTYFAILLCSISSLRIAWLWIIISKSITIWFIIDSKHHRLI